MKKLCLCVLIAACHFGEPTNTPAAAGAGLPSSSVLRSYDVPGDGAAQVRSVLKDLFWTGSDGKDGSKFIGRAEIGPNGRLVVMASEGVQDGVKSFIESLGQKPPRPAPTVETSYWLVFGAPGKSGPHPSALNDVAPALQQLEKADGPMEFTLGEKLSMTQISGETARVIGRDAQVRQVASANAAGISVEMSLERMGQKFETRVNLTPGQTMVLGSSGAVTKDREDLQRSVYVLVRSEIRSPRAEP